MTKAIALFFLLFYTLTVYSQTKKKSIEATKINIPSRINGVLDEAIWQSLQAYGNFNMYQPGNKGVIPKAYNEMNKTHFLLQAQKLLAFSLNFGVTFKIKQSL